MNDLETLIAKDRIIDVVNSLFVSTDQRDWSAVTRVLRGTRPFRHSGSCSTSLQRNVVAG